jgi:Ca-activated chloride channel family protein
MSFADDVMLLQDFSIDRRRNAVAIKETRVGDATSLYEAVWLALEQVLKPVPERNALVLFTDGVDTASRKASMKETLDLSRETRATIYSVYYNTERDLRRGSVGTTLPGTPPVILFPRPQVSGGGTGSTAEEYQRGRAYLADLSESSGGRVFDALRMEDLGGAFQGIAQELASQYSVGYYSTNPKHDGKFRKVEVKVSKPGLAVRTKKGYYARKDIEG